MNLRTMTNFKATALTDDDLHHDAPSIFALRPMQGVSDRYTFVPTSRLIAGLREHDWVPVAAEEQRIRIAARRGFQKHLLRFRRAEQTRTLDEWNVELVLLNSHDRGCAYQLHAGIYRRICHNGLVVGEGGFQTIRFRHAGLVVDDVVGRVSAWSSTSTSPITFPLSSCAAKCATPPLGRIHSSPPTPPAPVVVPLRSRPQAYPAMYALLPAFSSARHAHPSYILGAAAGPSALVTPSSRRKYSPPRDAATPLTVTAAPARANPTTSTKGALARPVNWLRLFRV